MPAWHARSGVVAILLPFFIACASAPASAQGKPDLAACPEIRDEDSVATAELCRDHEGCKLVLEAKSSCETTKRFLDGLKAAGGEGTPGLFGRRRVVTPEAVYRASIDQYQAVLEGVQESAETLRQLRGVPKATEVIRGKSANGDAYVYYGEVEGSTPHGLGYRFHSAGSVAHARFDRGAPTLSDILYAGGGRFVGTLASGKRTGPGAFVDSKGQLYVGDWVDDHIVRGRLVRYDGTRFVGTFRNSVRFEGKEHAQGGHVFEEGQFDAASLVTGKRFDASGNAIAVNRARDERNAAQSRSLATLQDCAELKVAGVQPLFAQCSAHAGCAMLLAAQKSCAIAKVFMDRLRATLHAAAPGIPPGEITPDALFEASLDERARVLDTFAGSRSMVERLRADARAVKAEARLGDIAVYYGQAQGEKWHGAGTAFFPSGEIQRGHFADGAPRLVDIVQADGVRVVGERINHAITGESHRVTSDSVVSGRWVANRVIEGTWLQSNGTRYEGTFEAGPNNTAVPSLGFSYDATGKVTAIDRPREAQRAAEAQRIAQMEANARDTEARIARAQAAAAQAAKEEEEARRTAQAILAIIGAVADARNNRAAQAQAAQQAAQQAAARRAQQDRERVALQQQLQAQRVAVQQAQQAERERANRDQQERDRRAREQQARAQQLAHQQTMERQVEERNRHARQVAEQQAAKAQQQLQAMQSRATQPPAQSSQKAPGHIAPGCGPGSPPGFSCGGVEGNNDPGKLAREAAERKREYDERMRQRTTENRAKQAEIDRKLQADSRRGQEQIAAYRGELNQKYETLRSERRQYVNSQASRSDAITTTVLSLNNCPTARFHNNTDISLAITYHYKGTVSGGKEGPSGTWSSFVGPRGTQDSSIPHCQPGWQVQVYSVRWQATADNYRDDYPKF